MAQDADNNMGLSWRVASSVPVRPVIGPLASFASSMSDNIFDIGQVHVAWDGAGGADWISGHNHLLAVQVTQPL